MKRWEKRAFSARLERAFFLPVLLATGCAHSNPSSGEFISCVSHPERYAAASSQLQELVDTDQADRSGDINVIDWAKVSPRDLERRAKVAELFAGGCFREAKDYAAAALVYQHGDTADHAFQAFIWAKRAIELGDATQKWLMASALDRYLVRSGQKQLFATQGAKDAGSVCWCLEPVETSFPAARRLEYTKKTLPEVMAEQRRLDPDPAACTQVTYCAHALKASPAGTVPGFW